ncbi:LINE-1 reverse transcriptase-like [Vitis vinifera]|uniref:LINE-1 reverse transcriptase-like n=1 Tax=Vitis vinifera TaxID=29760 RepID=A0A438BRY0_VITVI|nr:LINE-1 reverse transcriptase-like [Vitis vinifera]
MTKLSHLGKIVLYYFPPKTRYDWSNPRKCVHSKEKGGRKEVLKTRGLQAHQLAWGLYKLLAKVLANRLKKVLDRVVLVDQNAFVRGRQILDASLVANEVIDYWHKRKEKGLICRLDIEKAYDSINWKFLMKVLRKMGFGSRWMDWMWWCISTAKFSILINGVPAGFFSNSKGLWQGDPLSPYLFVLGMEVLSTLLRRAGEGAFFPAVGFGERGEELIVSHLLFVDDTLIFYKVRREQLTNLSWILAWFEAASGLRINLAKSVLIPVGEVDELEELAAELGCRLGALPTVYLGLPLGAHHKTSSSWDGVEERMRRRLAWWKRQYISKGGRITLIKSTLASIPIYLLSLIRIPSPKEEGGLGIRKLDLLNKALLGKLVWRYAYEKDNLWKTAIGVKYGQEGCGWRTKEVCGPYGVGLWKEIMKEADWCWESIDFKVGKGTRVLFWTDEWCSNEALSQTFPQLFTLAGHRNAKVSEVWDSSLGQGGWNLSLARDFNDWELDQIGDMLNLLRDFRTSPEEDSVRWKREGNGVFGAKGAYKMLSGSSACAFLNRRIWMDKWLRLFGRLPLPFSEFNGCSQSQLKRCYLAGGVPLWGKKEKRSGIPSRCAYFGWFGRKGIGCTLVRNLFSLRLFGVACGHLRFAVEKDNLWKMVIGVKYGQEDFGWRTKEARGTYEVGVWKEILKEAKWCWDNIKFKVGKGTRVKFWIDQWDFRISSEEDAVLWKGGGHGKYGVKVAYNMLAVTNACTFLTKCVWVDKVPTKAAFFAWEVAWGKILTLNRLQKGDGSFLTAVFCVVVKRKM